MTDRNFHPYRGLESICSNIIIFHTWIQTEKQSYETFYLTKLAKYEISKIISK